MELSNNTILNMLNAFRFVDSKKVKKGHNGTWLKSEFTHDYFPEIKFIMYYKLTKKGIFEDKFDLDSFEVISIKDEETILKFVKNTDTKHLDDIEFKKELPEDSVKDNFKNLESILASFVRIV